MVHFYFSRNRLSLNHTSRVYTVLLWGRQNGMRKTWCGGRCDVPRVRRDLMTDGWVWWWRTSSVVMRDCVSRWRYSCCNLYFSIEMLLRSFLCFPWCDWLYFKHFNRGMNTIEDSVGIFSLRIKELMRDGKKWEKISCERNASNGGLPFLVRAECMA